MTLDAYDWTWRHAQSRGNARLAVLAVADKVTGPDATARLGLAETMRRLGGVGKGTALKALADAVASGDLEIAEQSQGSRAVLYRIPGAVDYTAVSGPDSRPQTTASGPDSRPLTGPEDSYWSGSQTTTAYRSGSQTSKPVASGPDPRPQTLWEEQPAECGTRTRASFKAIERVNERVEEGAPASQPLTDPIPPFARSLVDRITAADVFVQWDLTAGEWMRLDAMLRRSGVDMLARHAVTVAARQTGRGESVSSARYFLRAWTNLPPAPTEGTVPAAPTAGPAGADVIPLNRPRTTGTGRAAQAAGWYADLI